MDTKKQTFWTDCLEIIKNKVPNQAFETWFSEVELIDLNQEEINLQVPNQYHYEWLEQKYRHLINEVVMKIGGNARIVNYSVRMSNKQINEIPKLNGELTSKILPIWSNLVSLPLRTEYDFESYSRLYFIFEVGDEYSRPPKKATSSPLKKEPRLRVPPKSSGFLLKSKDSVISDSGLLMCAFAPRAPHPIPNV